MGNNFAFIKNFPIQNFDVDTSVLEDWFRELEKADYDRDYYMAYPVYRVTWYDQNDDECNNYFDVESPRELARMIAFAYEVGLSSIEAIEVVTIRVTKEPNDLKEKMVVN